MPKQTTERAPRTEIRIKLVPRLLRRRDVEYPPLLSEHIEIEPSGRNDDVEHGRERDEVW